MIDQKDVGGDEARPLMPNVIAAVMLTISITFSVYYVLTNNYGIAEFSMLAGFGLVLSAIAWSLFSWMNKVGQRRNQLTPEGKEEPRD